MNLRKDNRIIVDLNKVQFSRFYYRNQYGNIRNTIPLNPSVKGELISNHEMALFHPDFPQETCLDRAVRLDLLDIWQPELLLKLTANHCLIYTGDKAISIYKEWSKRIFGKKNKS